MLLAATTLAIDAYHAGTVVGRLALLVLGIALLKSGLQLRRASRAAVPPPTWGTPPLPEPASTTAVAPPPPTTRADGSVRIGIGSFLISATVLSAFVAVVTADSEPRTVLLPTTAIGLPQDAAAGESAKHAIAKIPGLEEAQAAFYGTPPNGVIVFASHTPSKKPSEGLDELRTGFQDSALKLGEGKDVDPGKLGGVARCWNATISGTSVAVCAYLDRRSIVTTIDFLGGGLDAAAARGLQIREATVHKA